MSEFQKFLEERKKTMLKYYEPITPRHRFPSLESYIDADIKDEKKAEEEYRYLAKQLEDAGFKGFVSGVILIAEDERRHKQTLENILRGISQ